MKAEVNWARARGLLDVLRRFLGSQAPVNQNRCIRSYYIKNKLDRFKSEVIFQLLLISIILGQHQSDNNRMLTFTVFNAVVLGHYRTGFTINGWFYYPYCILIKGCSFGSPNPRFLCTSWDTRWTSESTSSLWEMLLHTRSWRTCCHIIKV